MAAIQMSADVREAAAQLRMLPGNIAAKHFAAALRKAMKPAIDRLKANTPVGPTGNLRRSVAFVSRKYVRDKTAVGLVGYIAAGSGKSKSAAGGKVRKGKDRGYHQGFLEFGTKERTIQKKATQRYYRMSTRGVLHEVRRQGGYIASSFASLGPFAIVGSKGRVQTKPKYPKAFFMKSTEPIRLNAMPVGGSTGKPPVKSTYEETRAQMQANMVEQLGYALEKAAREIDYLAKKNLA